VDLVPGAVSALELDTEVLLAAQTFSGFFQKAPAKS